MSYTRTAEVGLAVALLCAPALPASADRPGTFVSPNAGFSIRKPDGWTYLTEPGPAPRQTRARLPDAALVAEAEQHPEAPLVAISKYVASHRGWNPGIQVMLRPMGGLEGRPAGEVLALVASSLRNQFPDATFSEVKTLEVSGLPAAALQARYTMRDGDAELPTVSRMWLVPRGQLMFLIGMTGPQSGPEVSEPEFAAALASVEITP